MIKTEGLNELENDINRLIESYGDNSDLVNLISSIQADLRSGKFKNDSNKLRSSIQVRLMDNSLSISMLEYGYYLSFGVNGRKVNNALGLTNEVATAFGVSTGSKFDGDKIYGITPRRFYPLDIEERLIEILTQEL